MEDFSSEQNNIYSNKYKFSKHDYTNRYYININGKMKPLPSIDEIIKNASKYSKQSKYSCFIQYLFENEGENIREEIFESLKGDIVNLSKDFYGNYVIQGILEYYDEKKHDIFNKLVNTKVIIELCSNKYSCRVIQKLVDVLDDNLIKVMIELINNNLYKLFIDQNGNHVIHKIIKKLDEKDLECIYNTALGNINSLIINQYGSHIIQELFTKLEDKEKIKIIIDKIYENDLVGLCKDPYCNYIIQTIIDNYNEYIDKTFEKIKGNIYEFSQKDFSSYALPIIAKIIINGKNEIKKEICQEILENDKNNKDFILDLIIDKSGNYLLQIIMDKCPKEIAGDLINRLKEVMNNIPPDDKYKKNKKFIINKLIENNYI